MFVCRPPILNSNLKRILNNNLKRIHLNNNHPLL